LHALIRDRALALPDDPELIDELANVRLRETSPGVFRIDHDPDKHDDRAIALSLAAQHLIERQGSDGAVWDAGVSEFAAAVDGFTADGEFHDYSSVEGPWSGMTGP